MSRVLGLQELTDSSDQPYAAIRWSTLSFYMCTNGNNC